jgi:ribosomal protein S18 acetylase RimI-like enzyme
MARLDAATNHRGDVRVTTRADDERFVGALIVEARLDPSDCPPEESSFASAVLGDGSTTASLLFEIEAEDVPEAIDGSDTLTAYVPRLYVCPEDRGRGAARRIMTALLERLFDLGAEEVYLEASPEEYDLPIATLVRFYESVGFRRDRRERYGNLLIATPASAGRRPSTRANPPKSLSLWHATPHRFDAFDPDRSGLGTHFGTRRAAAFRMRHAGGLQGNRGAWSLDRYLIAARRPLRLRDTGDWTTEAGTEGALIAAGVLSPSDLPEARRHSGADFWRWARHRIEDAGYDSVVYTNNGEDAGNDSYVIWNHDQIQRSPARPARVVNPPPARRRVPRAHPRIDLIRRVVASVRSGSDGPHGLRSIGYGTQREVFELSPDEVLKVEYRPDDSDENLHENEVETLAWERASDEQARYLCPVLAAGDGWIVMRRAEDFDPGSPHDEREWEPLERISPTDACELNVGRIDGRLVLVDYGR